jgi:hypothetical protein
LFAVLLGLLGAWFFIASLIGVIVGLTRDAAGRVPLPGTGLVLGAGMLLTAVLLWRSRRIDTAARAQPGDGRRSSGMGTNADGLLPSVRGCVPARCR